MTIEIVNKVNSSEENEELENREENDASSSMLFEEDFKIPDDLYKTLNDSRFMPIRMCMSNYWGQNLDKIFVENNF